MIAKNMTTKFLPALLIVSMLLPAVLLSSTPRRAEAVAGVGDIVHDPIHSAWSWLNSTFLAVMSPSTVTATAATVANTNLHILDYAQKMLETILKTVIKRVLAKMTQSIINWINSDFHGAPLFIENPGMFFNDIAKTQVRQIVEMIGYDPNGFPYGKQVALGIIDAYKRQLDINARYTLSNVINDPDLLARYRTDFNTGGWNGFLINTQYPQNNYLGFDMMMRDSLLQQLMGTTQAPAQKVQSLLQQGMGFLSPQKCPTNPAYNNGINEFQKPSFSYNVPYPQQNADVMMNGGSDPTFDAAVRDWNKGKALAQVTWEKSNTCPGGLQNTTPGSVAANQVMTALNMPSLSTALDGAIGNSLSAIFDALINHFLDKGLNALSDGVSSVMGGGGNDNWSYNGSSFSGTNTSYGTSGTVTDLNIPQNVSVTIGQETSTKISGGTAPYQIATVPDPNIALAKITSDSSAGYTLTVKGIGTGQTFLIVRDLSSPAKTVAVQIAVNAIGDLVISPRNIIASINNPITATISGGVKPYTMQLNPNNAVALAVFSDSNFIVVGVGPGQTAIAFRDSSTPPKIAVVPITVMGDLGLIVQKDVLVPVNNSRSIDISGGIAPYIIQTVIDPTVASAQINNPTIDPSATGAQVNNTANIIISAYGAGQTAIVVQDSSTPPKTTTIQITAN